MKKLLVILTLIPVFTFAQNQRVIRLSYYTQPVEIDNQLEDWHIDGHKYFLNSWNSGTIIINDTINSPQKKILYDLVSEKLIIGEVGNNKAHVITDVSVFGFIIDNNYFRMMDKGDFLNPANGNSFFLLPEISKSPYLIVKYRKKIKEVAVNNGYNNSSGYRKYVQNSEYYILGKEKKYVKIKLTKKSILKILSDKESKIKEYVKKNKLNYKKENDIIKLLSFYHSLS